jgi:hypothetical protein
MNVNRSIITLLSVALLTVLAACGGGGGDGTTIAPQPPPTGGIDGGGFARGAISGFGSVIVNGVRFATTSAAITVDGQTGATESQLKVGQIVEVRGSFDSSGTTGTATAIIFDDSLEGPVSSIDLAAGTLVVLGQTVRVVGATVFDDRFSPASLSGVSVGQVVEVSGFPNATGEIVASRIEPKAAGGTFELTGVVSQLDTTARRFNIGATTISYANVTPRDGTLANGGCAEAKGTQFANGALTATSVEVKSCTVGGANNQRGEIEGVITRFVSASDFDIGSQRVSTTASTTYENGVAADLRAGLKVEAEGRFDANGTLVATKVQIKPDTALRLLGTVDALDAAANTLRMFGLTVTVNAGTSFEDKSRADLRQFRFADLRAGDYLEVRGYAGTSANSIVAARLEREDLESRRELQGVAASPATAPNLTILGITITTSGSTQFRNEADQPITSTQFFAAAGNRLVKVRGNWDGNSFTATQAELENF